MKKKQLSFDDFDFFVAFIKFIYLRFDMTAVYVHNLPKVISNVLTEN